MNKKFIKISLLATIFVLSFPFFVKAISFYPPDWQFVREINTKDSNGFAKIVLPPTISRTSRNFNDIRIIDNKGLETPLIVSRNISSNSKEIQSRIVNLTKTQGGKTQFVADMGQSGNIRNHINILTSSPDYRRQVTIYSSNTLLPIDSPEWSLIINDGYIFKFTTPTLDFISGKNDIYFSPSTARYFKVVIGEGVEGPVGVSGADFSGDIKRESPTYTKDVPVSIFNNPDKRTTEITADLSVSGYITNAITLNTNDKNYNRRVIIESSDDNVKWNFIGQGSISSISTPLFSGISNRVFYNEQKTRYIRASIVNDDNRPISFGNTVIFEGPTISIIFQTRAGESYKLYYGNPKARPPVYDITNISSYIEENKIPSFSLGEEMTNPAYIAPLGPVIPFTEAHKGLLNTLLVIVVFILISAIFWYIKTYLHKK